MKKKTLVKSKPLNPNAAVAVRYENRLRRLIDRMIATTEREVNALFKAECATEFFATDETISAQARILMNMLMDKFERIFSANAKPFSEYMVEENEKASELQLGASLKDISESFTLKGSPAISEVISASISENVGLIKTIPQKYLSQVQGAVMRSITTGRGLADLVPQLQKYKRITLKRARFIATDQTRKAFTNITKEKMQATGMKKWEWLHSGGGAHPRELHKRLSGRQFTFDNPPIIDEKTGERGFPSQLPNCRCKMVAVIDFSDF